GLGKATPTPVTPEMERVKRNQEQISSVLKTDNCLVLRITILKKNPLLICPSSLNFPYFSKGTPTPMTPEMERAKRNQENISSVLQGKAAYVLDTPEMRRVRETQKHISTVRAFMGVLNWQ
uniref:Uncharacterized protein n=1 Tax=Cairina moschata TaxID=8855 RepID=A0A8C3C963_CAIMO